MVTWIKKHDKVSFYGFLALLTIVSILLRVVSLSSFPPGFHFDEMNAGYNAYSLLETGNSVRNGPWPLYLDTFGDFRPMGLVYLMMPFIAIFGLTEFAVRLPIALIGSLTPLLLFFVVRRYSTSTLLAVISSIFLALSPWHIMLSRATSEAVLAVFMAILILYVFHKVLETASIKWAALLYGIMALSYITYHPINLFLLLFFPLLILFFWRDITKKKSLRLIILSVFVLYFIFPFLTGIMFSNSTGRLQQVVSIFSEEERKHLQKQTVEEGNTGNVLITRLFHNKPVNTTFELGERYVSYLTPQFLFFEGGLPKRYFIPDVGLVNAIEFLGLLMLFIPLAPIGNKKVFYMFLAWVLVGIIPAAITTDDQPNVSRAVLMLPAIQVLAAYGIIRLGQIFPKRVLPIIVGVIILGGLWHMLYFLHQYVVHEKYYQWLDRSYPAKEMVEKLAAIDKDQKIIVTTHFLDPELFIFFYNKVDPRIAQEVYAGRVQEKEKTLFNYTFVDEPCPLQKHPAGYDYAVEHAWCVEPKEFAVDPISGADGVPLFKIIENKKL